MALASTGVVTLSAAASVGAADMAGTGGITADRRICMVDTDHARIWVAAMARVRIWAAAPAPVLT